MNGTPGEMLSPLFWFSSCDGNVGPEFLDVLFFGVALLFDT